MSNIFIAIKLVAANIMASLSKRFGITSQKGATMIEYALIAALISVVALSTLTTIGTNVNTKFVSIRDAL